jgi:hypothetical protein
MNESRALSVTAKLLARASADRMFVGWALLEYENRHHMKAPEVAEWLRCTPDRLKRLALCRLPDDRCDDFTANVKRIAGYGGCDADRLIVVLREVLSLSALQAGESSDAGLLLAARDRTKDHRPEK